MGDDGLVGPLHLLDPPAGPGEHETKHQDCDRGKRAHHQRDDLHAVPRIRHHSSLSSSLSSAAFCSATSRSTVANGWGSRPYGTNRLCSASALAAQPRLTPSVWSSL